MRRAFCVEALAPATDAWRQIVIFAALASIFLGAVAAFGQTNIKRLLAYSSINNVGFALVGLGRGGPRGASAVLFYMAVYVVMTLGAFLCVLWMRDRRASRSSASPVCRACADAAGLCHGLRDLHVQPRRHSAACSASGPSCWCSAPRSQAAMSRSQWQAILGTVIGAYYYLRIVKVMYMDEPAAPYARVREPMQGPLILLAALFVSPLGYLLIGPLGHAHRPRRGIALLSRIRIVERTGSTNADLIADRCRCEGDWLVALEPGQPARAARAACGFRRHGNFYGSTLVELRAGDPPRADALARRRPGADRSGRSSRCPDQALMLKWPNDVLLMGKKLAGILLERSGERVVVGFGVNLASGPETRRIGSAPPCRHDHAAGVCALARGEF